MLKKNKAQVFIEYVVLIGVVVAALIVMEIYMKRSKMGQIREASDGIGQHFDPNSAVITSNRTRKAGYVEESSGGVTTTYSGYAGKGAAEVTTRNTSEAFDAW